MLRSPAASGALAVTNPIPSSVIRARPVLRRRSLHAMVCAWAWRTALVSGSCVTLNRKPHVRPERFEAAHAVLNTT